MFEKTTKLKIGSFATIAVSAIGTLYFINAVTAPENPVIVKSPAHTHTKPNLSPVLAQIRTVGSIFEVRFTALKRRYDDLEKRHGDLEQRYSALEEDRQIYEANKRAVEQANKKRRARKRPNRKKVRTSNVRSRKNKR